MLANNVIMRNAALMGEKLLAGLQPASKRQLARLRQVWRDEGYAALAFEILSLYIDDIPADDLLGICRRAYAPGREGTVEAAMSLSFVGTADDVATRLREQAARWDLDEILVVTYAHDPALRRRSYELLAQAWNA